MTYTDTRPTSAEILSKIATEATSAMTESFSDGVTAKTTAAMSDIYSATLSALSSIKLQIENLEKALELKRTQAILEVEAFTAASAEAMDIASAIGRALTRIEKTAMAS